MSNEKKPGCLGVKGIMLRSYVGIIRIPMKQPGFNGMSCRFSFVAHMPFLVQGAALVFSGEYAMNFVGSMVRHHVPFLL